VIRAERGAYREHRKNTEQRIQNSEHGKEGMSIGYMYIVECSDGTYYTGSTKNLERRIEEHNSPDRGANYTRMRQPVELVYYEEYDRIDWAFYREKQVQKWSQKKKLALIEAAPELLPKLAKKVIFCKRRERM
jgi:putative endonuclease